jgi:rhamnulose-1-phosphate aldolase
MKNRIREKISGLLEDVSQTAGFIDGRGWAEGTAGNISINVSDLFRDMDLSSAGEFCKKIRLDKTYPHLTDQVFLTTLSGSRMRNIAKNPFPDMSLIRILPNGNECGCYMDEIACRRNKNPTSELPTHLAIHDLIVQDKRAATTIIHAHATELIALTHDVQFKNADTISKRLWSIHPEVKVFIPRGVGFVPYALPGSEAIARETIEAIRTVDMVLWEKHGIFAIGNSLDETFDMIDIACKAAKIYFLCIHTGMNPDGLSGKELTELSEFFNLKQ